MLYFAAGFFDNGDNALVINMLGPQKSRPFIQSLHACTAIGFVVGNQIIFLPVALLIALKNKIKITIFHEVPFMQISVP